LVLSGQVEWGPGYGSLGTLRLMHVGWLSGYAVFEAVSGCWPWFICPGLAGRFFWIPSDDGGRGPECLGLLVWFCAWGVCVDCEFVGVDVRGQSSRMRSLAAGLRLSAAGLVRASGRSVLGPFWGARTYQFRWRTSFIIRLRRLPPDWGRSFNYHYKKPTTNPE